MLSQIQGIEQCTVVTKFNDRFDRANGDGTTDHWAVYLTRPISKRDPQGSGYAPFVTKIATYAGRSETSRMMALNHARALNALIIDMREAALTAAAESVTT